MRSGHETNPLDAPSLYQFCLQEISGGSSEGAQGACAPPFSFVSRNHGIGCLLSLSLRRSAALHIAANTAICSAAERVEFYRSSGCGLRTLTRAHA